MTALIRPRLSSFPPRRDSSFWVEKPHTPHIKRAGAFNQVIAWNERSYSLNGNHGNSKLQNTNLKQIRMTEILNSKQIE
jgi:hypothetical protein